jgi:hypothetical protein
MKSVDAGVPRVMLTARDIPLRLLHSADSAARARLQERDEDHDQV